MNPQFEMRGNMNGFSHQATEIHEAGFVQRREWMLYKIRDDHYPFNVPFVFEMDAFDPYLFQKTVNLMVEKHEILRTTLNLLSGELKQVIHHSENFPITYNFEDLSKSLPPRKEAILKSMKLKQLVTPFNFEAGPLFRITVFALDRNLYQVFVTFHHVIFDLHSQVVFTRDANSIWTSVNQGDVLANGTTCQPQYRSYAALENRILDSDFGDPYKDYWKTQLNNNDLHRLQIIEEKKWSAHIQKVAEKIKTVKKRIFALPFYDHRFISTVVRRYRPDSAGKLHYVYSCETVEHILEFEKSQYNSLLSLFIASFIMALNKLSGQQRFLFELASTRKKNEGYEDVIGWLATSGVCFFDVNKNKGASAFLSYIDEQVLMLLNNAMYPYEVLECESNFPLGCVIPVLLVLTSNRSREDQSEAGIIMHEFSCTTTYQDLGIFLSVSENSCSVEIYYNNLLIEPETIEKLISEQDQIMNSLAQDIVPR